MLKSVWKSLLCGSLVLLAAGFTSCDKYGDDIQQLEERVTALESVVNELKNKIENGTSVIGINSTEGGVELVLSDGTTQTIANGAKGDKGDKGDKGATGDKGAKGDKGDRGAQGDKGPQGDKGAKGDRGEKGEDGEDGSVVTIGEDGFWYIDDVKQEYKAKGEKGDKGDQGNDGDAAIPVYFVPNADGFWHKITEGAGENGADLDEKTEDSWLEVLNSDVISAVWDKGTNTLTFVNVGEDKETVVINLNEALSSLVFIPQVYINGIEGMIYESLYSHVITEDIGSFTGTLNDTDIPVGFSEQINSWGTDEDNYIEIPLNSYVQYHTNPSNAAIDGTEWEFIGRTPETKSSDVIVLPQVTRNGEPAEVVYQNGVVTIPFQLLYSDLSEENIPYPNYDGYVSVFAAKATKDDAVVVSDYASLAVKYMRINEICIEENDDPVAIYESASTAITSSEFFEIQYNGGSFDLPSKLLFQYIKDEDYQYFTLAELKEKYNLDVEIEPLPYKYGVDEINPSDYLQVEEDGKVTPMYKDEEGAFKVIPTDQTAIGKKSIGKRPVVLVKLVNKEGETIIAGWVTLVIVGENAQSFLFDKTVPAVPFICEPENIPVSWTEFENYVLDSLDMSKDAFVDYYSIEANGGQNVIYIFKDNKFEKLATETIANDKFGQITNPDGTDVLVYNIDFDQLKAIGADETSTLYIKYLAADGVEAESVYVGIKVKIAEIPVISAYGDKVDAYWNEEKTFAEFNVPIPFANHTLALSEYIKALDHYFYHNGNEPGIEFELEMDDVYDDVWEDYEVIYGYKFSDKNNGVEIGEKELSVNEDGLVLMWGNEAIASIEDAGLIMYKDNGPAKEFLNLFSRAEGDNDASKQQMAIIEITAAYRNAATQEDDHEPVDLTFAEGVDNTFNLRFLRPVDILRNEDNARFVDGITLGSVIRVGDLFTAKDWRGKFIIATAEVDGEQVYTPATDNGVDLFEYYGFQSATILLSEATSDMNQRGKQVEINRDVVKLDLLDPNNDTVTNNPVFTLASSLDSIMTTRIDTLVAETWQLMTWNEASSAFDEGELLTTKPDGADYYVHDETKQSSNGNGYKHIPAETTVVTEKIANPNGIRTIPSLNGYTIHYNNNEGTVRDGGFTIEIPVMITYSCGSITVTISVPVEKTI